MRVNHAKKATEQLRKAESCRSGGARAVCLESAAKHLLQLYGKELISMGFWPEVSAAMLIEVAECAAKKIEKEKL